MNVPSPTDVVNGARSLILLAAVTAVPIAAGAQEPAANFAMHQVPRPLPEFVFVDGKDKTMSIADFRGTVVLLNIWATWRGPCKREMPTLDRLQAALDGAEFGRRHLSVTVCRRDARRRSIDLPVTGSTIL